MHNEKRKTKGKLSANWEKPFCVQEVAPHNTYHLEFFLGNLYRGCGMSLTSKYVHYFLTQSSLRKVLSREDFNKPPFNMCSYLSPLVKEASLWLRLNVEAIMIPPETLLNKRLGQGRFAQNGNLSRCLNINYSFLARSRKLCLKMTIPLNPQNQPG